MSHTVVVGASGVIGMSLVEKFSREGKKVVAVSRRAPLLPLDIAFDHVSVDLRDERACRDAMLRIGPISELIYAAATEAPGLIDGWSDQKVIETNARMFANILDPVTSVGTLRWLGLLQGTKAYGAHLHPIDLPAREDRARDPHDNFYWEHEDRLRSAGAEHGFGWTIFRPQVLFGGAAGVAMNPVLAIGAYAAICRELELPFDYPATRGIMWEITDGGLLAAAHSWAAGTQKSHGQIYNVTNGDVFVLRDVWSRLASIFGLDCGQDQTKSLADFFDRPESIRAWARVVEKFGLRRMTLSEFLGQSHHYVDLLLDTGVVEGGGLPTIVSAIKIRKAGFNDCQDSFECLIYWLKRMEFMRMLPPDLTGSVRD